MKLISKTILSIIIISFFVSNLFAQEIEVYGNKRIETDTIKTYFEADNKLNNKKLNKILKELYRSNLFTNITIINNNNKIEIKILENPIINKIEIIGNKKISKDIITQEMSLSERDIYTKNMLNNDISRIYEIYKRSGRIHALIEPRVKFLDNNRIDLIINIKENDKVKIHKIIFHGNKNINSKKLKKILASKEQRWYRNSSSFFDPDKISFDQQLLKKFYFNSGYAAFKIDNIKVEYIPEIKGFVANFFITEGNIYNFAQINFISDYDDIDIKKLTKYLDFKSGERFSLIKIDNSIDNILSYLNNKGYAFADVDYRITKNSNDNTVNIEMDIKKNKKIYVRNINIDGNDRTEDQIIRRELRIISGDPYNSNKIRRSKQRLMNLGFFANVKIKKTPIIGKDLIDITFIVEEKPTGELNFGLGYSTTEKFLGEIAVRERNLLGKGHSMAVTTKKSALGDNIDLSYTIPNFLDREFSFKNRLFSITTDFVESDANSSSKGFSTGINYELSEYLTQSANYTIKKERIYDVSSDASIYIKEQEGNHLYSGISQGLYYDKRNNRFNPNQGYYLTLMNSWAGLGGNVKFLKTEIAGVNYKPFFSNKLIFKSALKAGAIIGYDSEEVTINHRFFLGGSSLRGFRYAGIGPRDSNDAALGGNYFYKSSLELLFPLGLPEELGFKGSIFTDLGNVFGLDNEYVDIFEEESIRIAAGIGVFWSSPLGPISFNFAKTIKKESFDKTETFRINFGTRF